MLTENGNFSRIDRDEGFAEPFRKMEPFGQKEG